MRAMENDPRQKQPGEKFMEKELSEKSNQRHKSKLTWNEAEYVKYKEQVESARIDAINGLISEFNSWSTVSDEEADQVYNLIQDLKNYVNLLYKINEELNDCIEYLKGE